MPAWSVHLLYFAFWLGRQRTACHFPMSLFLLQKPKLCSAIKFLNAFSLSLLKKKRTVSWTLKIMCCGGTYFHFPAVYYLTGGAVHMSFISNLMVKWGWAHELKPTGLDLLVRVWQIMFCLSFSSSILLYNGLLWIIFYMAKTIPYTVVYNN